MEWTDAALVLRVGRFRETDLWLRLLTRQHGVLSAFAFGGSRSRRRFTGCLDLLNVIHVRAKATRGGAYLNLEEGSLLEGPRRLRQDWRRLGMLMNCVRFLEAQGVASDTAQATFALMRSLLRLGEEADVLRDALPVLFRFRLASEQGYAPDFSQCGQCGAMLTSVSWFGLEDGILLCDECHAAHGGRRLNPLSAPVLAALCSVQADDPAVWNSLEMDAGDWRACTRLADSFVQFHLGLAWDRGRFTRR